MKSLLIIIIIAFVWYYWIPINNMVKGYWPIADKAITHWFVEHTPTK